MARLFNDRVQLTKFVDDVKDGSRDELPLRGLLGEFSISHRTQAM